MKRLNVNFDLLIVQLLPPHKRQKVRVEILQILFNLAGLYNRFVLWRKKQLLLINITSQIKVLEGYLRTVFGKIITIRENTDKLKGISLLVEGQLQMIGLSNEPGTLAPFPLLSEFGGDLQGADFIVIAPVDVDKETLAIEIEKFKQMDKKYIIKQE